MNIRRVYETGKMVFQLSIGFAAMGGFLFAITHDAVQWWVHRNEPVYLMSRAYEPIWRNLGYVPADLVCYSPARCEPNGKASPQYFVLLKEYEVRQWGFDPAHEIPIKGDPYN